MDKICPVLTVIAVLILLYILWCFIEPFFLDLDRAVMRKISTDKIGGDGITVKKLPFSGSPASGTPDLRFFFFSDIHAEWCPVTAKRLCDSIRKVHSKSPLDAVIFGGDIVTYQQNAKTGYRYLSRISECCRELSIPFYGITGNHDCNLGNAAEPSGFISLDNKTVSFRSHKSSAGIILAGLPDSGKYNRVWPERLPCSNTEPVVLITHDPDTIIHLAPDSRPDFMLSGHLHGGQMKFPFRIEFTILRKTDKLPQMGAVQGLYDISGTSVFISRGLGCGLLPFRFLSVPEATVVEINL
ncbi:MAG: metallophosphoesterase [Clostridiales bacterium]|nr:metallophosphoesterase [Clostridiales bacterium]